MQLCEYISFPARTFAAAGTYAPYFGALVPLRAATKRERSLQERIYIHIAPHKPQFLYLKAGYDNKAKRLASELPHTRESREVILPLIKQNLTESEINENIKNILLGDGKDIW